MYLSEEKEMNRRHHGGKKVLSFLYGRHITKFLFHYNIYNKMYHLYNLYIMIYLQIINKYLHLLIK